jgi:rare lipoprotein A (peptidoglycan hydrolase)
MRSFLAAAVAALAIAGGTSLPAEAFAGSALRDTAAGERGTLLHLARTTAGDEGEAKPTDRSRMDGQLARRTSTRARRHAKAHRQARRSTHRAQRHAVRSARRPAVRAIPAESGTTGVASFYGGRFHGRLTASGTRFDANGLTAAHRSLPFGTRVRVTHLGSGRSVEVRINDRGPYVGGRIIDLSHGAAGVLGMHGQGVARVKVTVLGR